MTFISIIIPFNKSKRYLIDCLDSLIEQNLEDSEIILILNGVKEDLNDLLNNYQTHLNIIIKEFEEEINVSKARNEGLALSNGEYIYFIDSDDYIYSNGLKKLIDVAHETDADFINGERISTPFIRDRFDEELEKANRVPFKKNRFSDMEYSMKLLVGTKTNKQEVSSVLHALIKRDKINDFRFDEEKRYHSDYDLFIECMPKLNSFVGVEESLYAKRARDDPIHLTSLNQESRPDKFLEYTDEYERLYSALEKYEKEESKEKYKLLKDAMADNYFNYYYKNFAQKFKNGPKKWRTKYFRAMQSISKGFNTDKLSFMQKQEVKALQDNKIKILKSLINLRLGRDKLKKITKSTDAFKLHIYRSYYNKKDVNENQVIFESFGGKFYADSPRYLYEYMYDNFKDDFKFVWVMNDKSFKIPGNPKIVKRFSLDFYKEVARSKYWVINGRQALRLNKKKNQVIVSTWHGTPLKKLGFDIENTYAKDPNTKKLYRRVGKQWDYLISPSKYVTDILRSSFTYEGEILEEGYPRNDILYNADSSKINQIKKDLNLPEDKKVILYAPTWRDDEFYKTGGVEFKLQFDLDRLNESLGDEYVLLIKTHYFIADQLDLSNYEGFTFDVSKYNDIAELYLISDILITDYSSVFFDFANLKKPILFYTYDLDRYENVLRGFYIDIREDVPGPLLFTTDDIINTITNIDELNEEYSEKYEEFYNRFCYIDDGNSSKRIVKKIWNK